jgi:flagellar L-ring protein precursor FlgH
LRLLQQTAAGLLAMLCIVASATAATQQQSLIDPATFRGPAADQRAYRVGDVLTVVVLESTTARQQAGTDSDRSTGFSASLVAPHTHFNGNLAVDGKHGGTAETTRVGELRAQITVRVTGIESNGLLRVSGKQSLVLNGEHQSITLSGLVRSEDISATNTIWSNQIADADVSLSGVGPVSEAQKRGIITRVMNWLGLP